MNRLSYRVAVTHATQTGEIRRLAVSAATQLSFSHTQQSKLAIVASELATNLSKHAVDGEFLIQEIRNGARAGLQLTTLDHGPGFNDVQKIMRDGYSTAGSPGTGLGAVKRLAHSLDVFSQEGKGSVFVAQLWADEAPSDASGLQYGAISVPYPGETRNGDGWALDVDHANRCSVMIADGLGHGEFAHQAAEAAVVAFEKNRNRQPEEILQYSHAAIRTTRGAAMAVAVLETDKQLVQYAGVGNISAAIVTPDITRRMVSHDGTVGHALRKVQKFTYPWSTEAVLIMHSDGLTANWNLERYPGLLNRHASVIAGVLYRDCRRKNDDATVLVARVA